MLIANRTLTVNAAFLQEIKDDDHDLQELWDEVLQTNHEARDGLASAARVAESLGRLRDQLALHFSLEEAYGYFECAVDVAPWLNERASTLRREHQDLYLELCDLVELAEKCVYRKRSVRALPHLFANFDRFYEHFHKHESDENELIFMAFDDDIGVGD